MWTPDPLEPEDGWCWPPVTYQPIRRLSRSRSCTPQPLSLTWKPVGSLGLLSTSCLGFSAWHLLPHLFLPLLGVNSSTLLCAGNRPKFVSLEKRVSSPLPSFELFVWPLIGELWELFMSSGYQTLKPLSDIWLANIFSEIFFCKFFFYILMSFDAQKDIFMKSSLSSFSCVKLLVSNLRIRCQGHENLPLFPAPPSLGVFKF